MQILLETLNYIMICPHSEKVCSAKPDCWKAEKKNKDTTHKS
jgi:hypothetical protein